MQDVRNPVTEGSGSRNRPSPANILRIAGMVDADVERILERNAGAIPYSLAMNLAVFYERLVGGGVPDRDAAMLASAQSPSDVSAPHTRADSALRFLRETQEGGASEDEALASALEVWARKGPKPAQSAAETLSRARESAPEVAGASPDRPSRGKPEKGGRAMPEQERQNGIDPMARAERERERLEREHAHERERLERERLERERERLEQEHEHACERLEREREKLEREQEKVEREQERLEHLQEEIESRIERQQERLEELQNQLEAREEELEAREEELEEAEEELEDLEIDGVEGVKEMLDVVSQRIPNLMRGIQETVYSPEAMKTMADSFVTFFKSLVDAGMDPAEATAMTKLQMVHMQSQGFLTNPPYRASCARPTRPARPARPVGSPPPVEEDTKED